jgi:uroporphyrinogen-III synthase
VSKRVLVTRAPHQASALADQLRAHGLDPVLIPTIDIAPPTSYCALDAALACLPTHHWLLFTSANAVDCFFQRLLALRGMGLSPSGGGRGIYAPEKVPNEREGALAPGGVLPTSCHVAAIGPATARALESLGTKPDLIPSQAVAESLAAALLPHALQPDGTPTRFLIPRAQEARNTLEEKLKDAGADVTIAPVYRNIIPPASIQAVQALFATPATYPDAITFTSSSTATNLLALLEAASLTLPPEILRISIGPITSDTLRDLGLPPHAESSTATIPSLVEKVVEVLEPHKISLEG